MSARRAPAPIPGPICYGRGGELPTITDANLVLGRLDPGHLLAVARPVTVAQVREVFGEQLARPLGIDVDAAAAAVIRLGNTHMAGAIRMVSLSPAATIRAISRCSPSAAPARCTPRRSARELGIPTVLVPARPGITNALGCLVADLRHDFVRTLNQPLTELDMAEVQAVALEQQAGGRRPCARDDPVEVETVLIQPPTCSSAARPI